MRKVIVTTLVILLSLIGLTSDKTNGESHHVIFYVAHQDDETLTFGSSIHNHVHSGHHVHIILLTDGSSTFVRERLKMTREQITNARNKEFKNAVAMLGISENNVHKMGFRDSSLQVNDAKNVIKMFETDYPNAIHNTHTYTDSHPDHANLGIALKELSDEGIVTEARYYVRKGLLPEGKILIKAPYKDDISLIIKAASRSYNVHDKQSGLYGIGWMSVPDSFEALEKDHRNYYHK